MSTDVKSPAFVEKTKPAKEKSWAPRFWMGCEFFGFMRLMSRNRFAIEWKYLYIAILDTVFALNNTFLKGLQWLIFGRRIAKTELTEQPLFVIGHWRCGTTLLHELLVLDPRHTYPTSFACFAPNHFLLTEPLSDRLLWFLLPSHRPMDDMVITWDSPQEDEFALCNLGLPSPYWTMAFPNHPPQCQEYLDLEGVPASDLARWKRGLLRFMQAITCRNPKRIILKSPPHTCRIKVLLELFPGARFVHIVRNPYNVYMSTVKMWKRMYEGQGFQKPRFEGLEEQVLKTFARMHDKLEETRGLVAPQRFYEVKYEDLVADPLGEVAKLYEHLEMGGFDDVAPAIQKYVDARANYKTQSYEMSKELQGTIAGRWGGYIEKYGYAPPA